MEFFLEKTGCDAATLSAPFLLHGSEAGLLENATLQSDPSIHLSFACEELLVSSQVILTHEDCREVWRICHRLEAAGTYSDGLHRACMGADVALPITGADD